MLVAVDDLEFVDTLVLLPGAGIERVKALLDLGDEVLVLR
jgi:hypothetical protein